MFFVCQIINFLKIDEKKKLHNKKFGSDLERHLAAKKIFPWIWENKVIEELQKHFESNQFENHIL